MCEWVYKMLINSICVKIFNYKYAIINYNKLFNIKMVGTRDRYLLPNVITNEGVNNERHRNNTYLECPVFEETLTPSITYKVGVHRI